MAVNQEIYQQAFSFFDRNHDGKITSQDLALVLKKLGHTPTQPEVETLLQELNSTSGLTFQDFMSIVSPLETQENSIRQSFQVLDRDNNGFITASDLKSALRQLDEELSPEDIEHMVKEADSDKDGQVSYEDFKRIITAPIPSEGLLAKSSFRGL